jgi:rhamnogalacturonan endolyase
VPADLTFVIGESLEERDWYYAQTRPGTWTVQFEVRAPFAEGDTAHLTIAASSASGYSPVVALNSESKDITGVVPSGSDGALAVLAAASGYPRVSELTFPAELLKVGTNTITFTRPAAEEGEAADAGMTGLGWDCIVLEVDAATPPEPAMLTAVSAASTTLFQDGSSITSWLVQITNEVCIPTYLINVTPSHA